MRKKGVSLIVLVVTIIVMIILATVVVLSLNHSNIVNKAADATKVSNLKAIEEATQIEYTNLMEASETGEIEMTDEELQNHMRQKLNEQGLDGSRIVVVEKEIIIVEKDDFVFTIATTTSNKIVAFPIFYEASSVDKGYVSAGANDFVIDYGDGKTEHITVDTVVENKLLVDTTLVEHEYATPGIYTVKIRGKCRGIDEINFLERWIDLSLVGGVVETIDDESSFAERYNLSSIARIRSIVQWGNIQLELFTSNTVAGVLPSPTDTSFDKLSYMDLYNSEISGIPADLLYGCDKLKEVTFARTNITEIPETLFRDCVNLEVIYGVFARTNIIAIPNTLFDNCNKIKDCGQAFNGCTKILGAVPRIWEKSTVTNSHACYGGIPNTVTNYADIPEDCLHYEKE